MNMARRCLEFDSVDGFTTLADPFIVQLPSPASPSFANFLKTIEEADDYIDHLNLEDYH